MIMKGKLFLFFLLIVGFFYRIYGLNNNYSFWTDENHVAIFVRAILERGRPVLANGYSTGIYQWLLYWLSAISAKIFGLNEFAIRFPSVVFGVLTILAVYLLGRELFTNFSTSEEANVSPSTGGFSLPLSAVLVPLVAAFFTSFLKIEILWSRQARPYQALQFFLVLGALFVWKLSREEKFNWRYFLGFLGCGILASLVHGLGLMVFVVGLLYLLIFRFSWFRKWLLPAGILVLIFGYVFRMQIFSVISSVGKVNNLFYYRVFLWHNYPFLVFLALIGGTAIFLKNKQVCLLLVLPLAVQGFVASFLLGQPFVRYFYPVFPFLILLSAFGLVEISQGLEVSFLSPRRSTFGHLRGVFGYSVFSIFFALVLFIIAMGNKFTLLPTKVYSLNEDMQEIPEVDWKKIYGFVREKLSKDENLILITNWNDLPVWYLGEGSLDYLVRKPPKENLPSVDPVSGAKMIYSLEEFRKITETTRGLIVIDSWDDRIPEGIADYCHQNLKREFEIDRLYHSQPRYWTVWIYSWDSEKEVK